MNKKMVFAILLLIFLSACVSISSFESSTPDSFEHCKKDDLKCFGFDEEGFLTNQGFFKWKVDVFLPEKSELVGLGPFTIFADYQMQLKDINQTILVPIVVEFEGKENYETVTFNNQFFKKVDDKEELNIFGKRAIFSFLGLNIFSFESFKTINVNDFYLRTATVHVPESMQLSNYFVEQGHVFELSKKEILFHDFKHGVLIYFNPMFKLLVNVALLLSGIVFLIIIFKFVSKFPSFDFKSKHFLFLALITGLLILQLAFIIPNPNAIVLEFNEIVNIDEQRVPGYLSFVLGLTNSVDAIIVKDKKFCNDIEKNLLEKGTKKIFIEKSGETNENCYLIGQELSKTEIGEKVSEIFKTKTYPWSFLFDFSKRLIFVY